LIASAGNVNEVVDGVEPEEPGVQLAGRQSMRSRPAHFQESQYRNSSVEGRKLFDEAPVLGIESVPWIKSIDDEDIAIDQDQSDPLLQIDPFLATF